MKTYTIDIHPHLQGVTFSVKNGRAFEKALIAGEYKEFDIQPDEESAIRIRQFAIKHADDKSSNHGCWYAHCNMYAMDLIAGRVINKTAGYAYYHYHINTYRPYGRTNK